MNLESSQLLRREICCYSPWNLASKKGLARERMRRCASRVDPSDSLNVTSEKVPWGRLEYIMSRIKKVIKIWLRNWIWEYS